MFTNMISEYLLQPRLSQYTLSEVSDMHRSFIPGICTRHFDRNCFCVATEAECISAAHCHRHDKHLNRLSQSKSKLSYQIYSSIAVCFVEGNVTTSFLCCLLFVILNAAKSINFYMIRLAFLPFFYYY